MKVLKLQRRYFMFFGYTTHIEIIKYNKLLIEMSKYNKLLIEMSKYRNYILRERI